MTPVIARHIGFTGTRHGMKAHQMETVIKLMAGYHWLHHGKCVGGDLEAHAIARSLRMMIAIHPPIKTNLIAQCTGDIEYEPLEYIARNHVIVDSVETMIAAPYSSREENRSGTWATIRYARNQGRPLFIVLPDGSIIE
jgi:hypothetical protein